MLSRYSCLLPTIRHPTSFFQIWVKSQVGKFAFVANSRARSVDDTEGLVKFISDKKTDKILGAHIMGPNAGMHIQPCLLSVVCTAAVEPSLCSYMISAGHADVHKAADPCIITWWH